MFCVKCILLHVLIYRSLSKIQFERKTFQKYCFLICFHFWRSTLHSPACLRSRLCHSNTHTPQIKSTHQCFQLKGGIGHVALLKLLLNLTKKEKITLVVCFLSKDHVIHVHSILYGVVL